MLRRKQDVRRIWRVESCSLFRERDGT